MTPPIFSVVVPTRDRPGLLAEALASIQAQTCDSLECLVVDDASAQPPEIPDDPRFRLIRLERNAGPSAARNRGMQEAAGSAIAFLDDDDIWTPDRLELAERGLARAPVAVCATRYLDDPGGGRARKLDGWVDGTILDGLTPALGATAVERSVTPPFNEGLDNLEDADWWLRLASVAPVCTVDEVGLLYRRHSGSRDRTSLSNRIDDNERLLGLHSEWFAAHPDAAAFRWRRTGLLALSAGDRARARRAFVRSLRIRPSARSAWHLARASTGIGAR